MHSGGAGIVHIWLNFQLPQRPWIWDRNCRYPISAIQVSMYMYVSFHAPVLRPKRYHVLHLYCQFSLPHQPRGSTTTCRILEGCQWPTLTNNLPHQPLSLYSKGKTGKGIRLIVFVSTEMFTRPSFSSRPVHTDSISISRGIFQSS